MGLRPDSRPIRGSARIYEEESSGEPIGIVTSGGFGPSLNAPVAIGYVPGATQPPAQDSSASVGMDATYYAYFFTVCVSQV